MLTEKAAKVFRFEEQNQLHEEIIDTGLAQIYQSHLEVAERMASEAGVAIKKTLLDGKAFQKILDHARKTNPWLLVRRPDRRPQPEGRDRASAATPRTSSAAAPCDILLSTRLEVPRPRRARRGDHPLDARGRGAHDARARRRSRASRAPASCASRSRRATSVITNAVIDEAMDRFMPKSASAATKALAEAVALERAKAGPVSMCRACGVTATQSRRRCSAPSAAATDFEVISPEMIEQIAEVEGGLEEETTYDGRKLALDARTPGRASGP